VALAALEPRQRAEQMRTAFHVGRIRLSFDWPTSDQVSGMVYRRPGRGGNRPAASRTPVASPPTDDILRTAGNVEGNQLECIRWSMNRGSGRNGEHSRGEEAQKGIARLWALICNAEPLQRHSLLVMERTRQPPGKTGLGGLSRLQ